MLTCLDHAQELHCEGCLKNRIIMDALPIGCLVNLNCKFVLVLDDFITNSRRFYAGLLEVVYCEVV